MFMAKSKSEVCYDKMGCFSNDAPWNRPPSRIANLPESPEKVCTNVIFFNREVKNVSLEVYPNIDEKISNYFDNELPTFFITHGYKGSGSDAWLHDMVKVILNKTSANVFIVNWKEGAKGRYPQAIGNNRMAAKIITNVIDLLVEEKQANLTNFHLIGHSLGAHLSCYIGKNLGGKIGWLYALDPAGPYYNGVPEHMRCTPKDAKYVEVHHTNIGTVAMGYAEPCGIVDFYYNNAFFQPNCVGHPDEVHTCSHFMSCTYFTAVIGNDTCFVGQSAKYEQFKETNVAKYLPIAQPMARSAKPTTPAAFLAWNRINRPGIYAVNTKPNAPYCNNPSGK